MKAHEMTDREIEGHSTIADLCRECGYASAREFLNRGDNWLRDVSALEDELREELESIKS